MNHLMKEIRITPEICFVPVTQATQLHPTGCRTLTGWGDEREPGQQREILDQLQVVLVSPSGNKNPNACFGLPLHCFLWFTFNYFQSMLLPASKPVVPPALRSSSEFSHSVGLPANGCSSSERTGSTITNGTSQHFTGIYSPPLPISLLLNYTFLFLQSFPVLGWHFPVSGTVWSHEAERRGCNKPSESLRQYGDCSILLFPPKALRQRHCIASPCRAAVRAAGKTLSEAGSTRLRNITRSSTGQPGVKNTSLELFPHVLYSKGFPSPGQGIVWWGIAVWVRSRLLAGLSVCPNCQIIHTITLETCIANYLSHTTAFKICIFESFWLEMMRCLYVDEPCLGDNIKRKMSIRTVLPIKDNLHTLQFTSIVFWGK